jgi:hypothetical protein
MYLQDAQNLFNENAEYGNWEIDKKLAVMSEYKIGKIIVIAIRTCRRRSFERIQCRKTVLGRVTKKIHSFCDGNPKTIC